MISAEEYLKKEYNANHLKRCIELNDVQSIYSLMEEFADNTKPVKSVVLDLVMLSDEQKEKYYDLGFKDGANAAATDCTW